jgi:hypothetical protein
MRRGHLSGTTLFAGILSIAIGGCSNSTSGSAGSGGATSSGGGSGGVTGKGGNAAGGASGTSASGGANGTGGAQGAGGLLGTGGHGAGGSGSGGSSSKDAGTSAAPDVSVSSGGNSGGTSTAGISGAGGVVGSGGRTTGRVDGGPGSTGGITGTGGSTSSGTSTGTCTASKAAGASASGSGPHKVTVETNSDPGISEGTIYRPTDLGGSEKYPIFVWGEGGCSQNGSSNALAMGEIASHGYFIIADGTPGGSSSRSMDTSNVASMGKPLLAYITWAIAENAKPCSAYYQSLDTTKIAANGFSCGGLMSEGTAGDSRMTTWGLNSSGLFSADQAFYKTIHTPVLIVLGGSSDIAYTNGERDYDNISALGIPIMLFSKDLGHGGDLAKKSGDFAKIDLAWLNWWLKGDESATGKGLLVGSGCTYCTDSAWEVKSKNLP